MEGQNTVGVLKNAERLVEIIAFLCVFILLVVVERDDGSLQGSHLKKRKKKKKRMKLEPVTYVRFGLVYW